MAKKTGLGRGLDALFSDNATTATEDEKNQAIPISEITPNRSQPRTEFDEAALSELADSILQHGIITPLLLRPMPNGGYQIVAGERRYRAARMAGLSEVPALVKELSDAQVMVLALIENLQREDLGALEESRGYQTLMEQFDFTQEQVAKQVGKSRPAVANSLRLLNLPKQTLRLLEENRLSAGHARALLALEEAEKIDKAALEVIRRGLSVRETERLASKSAKDKKVRTGPLKPSLYSEVELALSEQLGKRITVSVKGKKGILSIEFYSQEELKALAACLENMK